VVAPAGSVLRVRLDQALDIERSLPGDRLSRGWNLSLTTVPNEIPSKGTILGRHVLNAQRLNVRLAGHQKCHGALTTGGGPFVGAGVAIAGAQVSGKQEVSIVAESFAGFTLKNALVE